MALTNIASILHSIKTAYPGRIIAVQVGQLFVAEANGDVFSDTYSNGYVLSNTPPQNCILATISGVILEV